MLEFVESIGQLTDLPEILLEKIKNTGVITNFLRLLNAGKEKLESTDKAMQNVAQTYFTSEELTDTSQLSTAQILRLYSVGMAMAEAYTKNEEGLSPEQKAKIWAMQALLNKKRKRHIFPGLGTDSAFDEEE